LYALLPHGTHVAVQKWFVFYVKKTANVFYTEREREREESESIKRKIRKEIRLSGEKCRERE